MADKNFQVNKGLTVANTVIVTNGSFVGINNSNPTVALHVTGDASISANLSVLKIVANSSVGTSGQVLSSNGTGAYWATIPGSNTQLLFNDSGSSNASAGLVFNKTSNTLTVGNTVLATTVNAATLSVGTSTVSNATGVWTTGTVNAASLSSGTGFTANSTLVNAVALMVTSNTVTLGTTIYVTATGNVGIGNTAPALTLYVNGSAAGAVGTLTDAANVTVDLSAFNNYNLTLNGNRNINNPTGLQPGQSGVIFLSQNTSGGQVPTWSSFWKFPGNTAPTLSTSASAVDAIVYVVRTSTSITAQAILNVG